MSIDVLQEKIRKLKNPSVIELNPSLTKIPAHILEESNTQSQAYGSFCSGILNALKGVVPAVRFSYSWYSLMGPDGLQLLNELLQQAKSYGFYVLLDAVQALSTDIAQRAADSLFELPCDGIVVSSYIGTDGLKPYVKKLKGSSKSFFVVIRTANKSAPELQDLMTGSRLVHMAAADSVTRLGENLVGRCGYSQVAGVGAASSADSLRNLRNKYKSVFLLVDGYDYPNANAKNCSFAFDKLGHGAVVCAGDSITGAWMDEQTDEKEFAEAAVRAAEKMKKNITRYITVL